MTIPFTPEHRAHLSEAMRAYHASKTHCPQGHPWTPETTYVHTDKHGVSCRRCRVCRRLRMREWRNARPTEERGTE